MDKNLQLLTQKVKNNAEIKVHRATPFSFNLVSVWHRNFWLCDSVVQVGQMLFIEKTFVLCLCLQQVLLNGTSLIPVFWRWGSAEVGEENRKHLEMCFWNKLWVFFFFALASEFDLSAQAKLVRWDNRCQCREGSRCSICLPTPCWLLCVGSSALVPSSGAGSGLTEGPQPHAVCKRAALSTGVLDAAGRRGGNLRVCDQTTPYERYSLHSWALLIIQSKAGKKSNCLAFPGKCPFPFPFHLILLWPMWSDFMPGHALGGALPAAACHGTWWPSGPHGLQP